MTTQVYCSALIRGALLHVPQLTLYLLAHGRGHSAVQCAESLHHAQLEAIWRVRDQCGGDSAALDDADASLSGALR